MTRWRTRPLEGDSETYDGTNAGVIEAFAGDSWVGMRPVVRDADGNEKTLQPGWSVSRADGAAPVIVSSPGGMAAFAEPAP